MAVPYTFGTATSSIPLSQLDSNFNTAITLGNTAIQLGNTATTLNNMTLANVTIASGNVTLTNVTVTTANVTTANITTAVIVNDNVTNLVATSANVTTANVTTANITNNNVSGSETLSGGTANGVAYLNGSKVVTTGSALTFDGTTFGATKIATNGATGTGLANGEIGLTNSAAIRWRNGANSGYVGAMYIDSSNNMNFDSGGSVSAQIWGIAGVGEAMRLTSTGLGIGTSSPLSKLTIQTQSVARLSARTTESVFGTVTGGSAWDSLNGSDSALAPFGLRGNGVYINDGTGTTTFSGGNLGLGVTPSGWGSSSAISPVYITKYNGNALWSPNANETILTNNAYYTGAAWIYNDSFAATQYSQLAGVHRWFNSASGTAGNAITFTQAMTLDASGNLLVGSTSVVANANNFVYSPGNAWGIFGHVSGTASGIDFTKFYYNGAQIGSISQSGTTAVLYNLTSDQRLKTNIVDAAPASALIDAIQVRQYDWKSDGSHQRYGFIAQELVTVAPEAVHQPADPEEMMAVDYSKLVPMLVKEIQDLRKRLAAAGI